MYPILFDGSETKFESYGLGVLSDCIRCEVTEERNGMYELEMEYPVSGIHFEDIAHSRIVYAKPSQNANNQAFRIYKITKPRNGIVTISAEHISYQLNFIPTSGATAENCAGAMAGLKNNAHESCPFTFESNNNTKGTYTQDVPASIRSRLGGVRGSVLDIFGGEYEWDNFTVRNWESRGTDNGVTLRYGKNITDIKQEENIENAVTGVCPYWTKDDNGTQVTVTLPEKVLHAPTASLYPFQRTMVLDCSSEFEEQPTIAELRQYASNYMVQNDIGYPSVNITVSFVALWQTEEYQDVAPLESVSLCDYVHIYYEKLGIEATSKVIKTKYDTILERYLEIELGDAKSSLGETIRGEIQDETRDKVSNQELFNAVERATALITGNEGGYVRFMYDEETGLPYEILIMDTQDIDTAKKVWRWNKSGLGYSSTGYDGTYGLAITQNGEIVADYIKSGTINAVDIEAINNVTGYFTKINTSTGNLTWNMKTSSLDTDGNFYSRGTYRMGLLQGGVYVKKDEDPTVNSYDAGINFRYKFSNMDGNVMSLESEQIAFKGRLNIYDDTAKQYWQSNEDGWYVGTDSKDDKNPFDYGSISDAVSNLSFGTTPVVTSLELQKYTFVSEITDSAILYQTVALVSTIHNGSALASANWTKNTFDYVRGANVRPIKNGICT